MGQKEKKEKRVRRGERDKDSFFLRGVPANNCKRGETELENHHFQLLV